MQIFFQNNVSDSIKIRKSLLSESNAITEETSSVATTNLENFEPETTKVPKSKSVANNLAGVDGLPVLPPPPSFKSVHFAPNVNDDESIPSIPTEGLPTRPATSKEKIEER